MKDIIYLRKFIKLMETYVQTNSFYSGYGFILF